MRIAIVALVMVSLAVPVIPSVQAVMAHGGYQGRIWQDTNGRYRCMRPDGTVGLIVGGTGGALIGRAIDTHGERATGTIIGAAAGALMGRKIERSRVKCK
jgi:outer membrane lipoprotein SlyB